MTVFTIDKNENEFSITNGTTIFSYLEHEGIEILVSLLRVFYEYKNLYKNSKYIQEKTIMVKPEYGLTVIISDNRLNVILNDCCLFNYGLLEINYAENCIYNFLNLEYGPTGIDFRWFDPFYLEHMLGVDLPYITGMTVFHERIENLYFYNRTDPKKAHIYEHQLYINLKNGTLSVLETKRINGILSSVSKSRLLNERFYGVVYDDEMVIRDGTHRIACLYYLYGNINIPIMRIKTSKKYYSYSMYKAIVNNQQKDIIK